MPMTWGEKEDRDRRHAGWHGDVSPAHRWLSQGAGGGSPGPGGAGDELRAAGMKSGTGEDGPAPGRQRCPLQTRSSPFMLLLFLPFLPRRCFGTAVPVPASCNAWQERSLCHESFNC